MGIKRLLLAAASLALAAQPFAECPAQDLAGPPAGATASPGDGPKVSRGVASLKLPADSEWTSSGLTVRKGERVRVRAWGRVRIAAAGGALVDPNGVPGAKAERLVPGAPAAMLIGVVGEQNNDYIEIGKEADFTAPHDGVLYLCLNQVDPAGNEGEYDVRVSVGHASSLSFNAGETLAGPEPPAVKAAPDGAKVITVSPRLDWTNTYIQLRRGDVVEIEASGRVELDLAGKATGPAGIPAADPGKLIVDKPTGALIAVVGVDNNDFVFVGAKGRFTSERDGLLFLGVNEEELANNSGSFTARVRVTRPGSP